MYNYLIKLNYQNIKINNLQNLNEKPNYKVPFQIQKYLELNQAKPLH